MIRMASDPVPNIRFNVSKTLEKMAPRLEVGTGLFIFLFVCFHVMPFSLSVEVDCAVWFLFCLRSIVQVVVPPFFSPCGKDCAVPDPSTHCFPLYHAHCGLFRVVYAAGTLSRWGPAANPCVHTRNDL